LYFKYNKISSTKQKIKASWKNSQDLSGQMWRRENQFSPPEFESRTVQAVASRYID